MEIGWSCCNTDQKLKASPYNDWLGYLSTAFSCYARVRLIWAECLCTSILLLIHLFLSSSLFGAEFYVPGTVLTAGCMILNKNSISLILEIRQEPFCYCLLTLPEFDKVQIRLGKGNRTRKDWRAGCQIFDTM